MKTDHRKLMDFVAWAKMDIEPHFSNVVIGIADPNMENTAWANIDGKKAIASIKFWDTGDYYLEILTLETNQPRLSTFGLISEGDDFSNEFESFLDEVRSLEKA